MTNNFFGINCASILAECNKNMIFFVYEKRISKLSLDTYICETVVLIQQGGLLVMIFIYMLITKRCRRVLIEAMD